jgi:hypothetical protein
MVGGLDNLNVPRYCQKVGRDAAVTITQLGKSLIIEPTPIVFYSDIVALIEVTFGSKSFNDEMVQAAGYVRETRFSQPFLHFVPVSHSLLL